MFVCIVLFIICVGMQNFFFFIYRSAKVPSGCICFLFLHSCCVKSSEYVSVCLCVCVWGERVVLCREYTIFLHLGFSVFPDCAKLCWRNPEKRRPAAPSARCPCVEAGRYSHYVSTLFVKASVWLLLACLNVCVWQKRPKLNNRPSLNDKALALSLNSTHFNFLPVPLELFMLLAHYKKTFSLSKIRSDGSKALY